MSDRLLTYPIDKLSKWILTEEKEGKIFGYYKNLFYRQTADHNLKIKRYNQTLSNPFGVAAGPHTQLSQNIILSWLFGARYIELKTVQVLDDIEVAKPCIDMYDEGYNCEWSQELTIEQSFDQYVDAWILIHILNHKYNYDFETIFNVSVGYDLKGIQSEKVKKFLTKIRNAKSEIAEKKIKLRNIYPEIEEIEIPNEISNNVTLSTMHGCPPNEIEAIAKHLIEDWKFHTAVKLNPTLLDKEKLREILNDKLGYEITIPDEAFEHDLKMNDAKRIISKLIKSAEKNNVEFGLKMTNTLESLNDSTLPESQNMVYMSGRSLHPLSVNAALMLQREFNGQLDISFSGGADAFNFHELIKCGLQPVTVCSDLLKPGGYSRIPQYLSNLSNELAKSGAQNIDDYITHNSVSNNKNEAAFENLKKYAEDVIQSERYKKKFIPNTGIKTKRELTELDCIHPPCVETCAISQDVPNYLYHTSNEEYDKAYQVILQGNPLPNITGMVCDHLCQTKCTRMNIDNSLLIREIKRFVSDKEKNLLSSSPKKDQDVKVAVIGAGPSGLSAAYFLALKGIEVEVFESHKSAGGMAQFAIPQFRIDEKSLIRDIENIESLGVQFHFDHPISKEKFNKLRSIYDFVYIAVGAQKGKKLGIEGEENERVMDQLTFLQKVKENESINIGEKVAVIGGGNSAIDAARTAKRLVGSNGEVIVLYRRTQNEMPADKEEIKELLEENISILELTAPKKIIPEEDKLKLVCKKMKQGELDNSGRRKPIETGEEFELSFNTIISAIGQEVSLDFLPDQKLEIDKSTNQTQFENVYAGGDVIRGADTLINAIADGKKTAYNILAKSDSVNDKQINKKPKLTLQEYQQKLSRRVYGESMKSLPPELRNNFELVNPILNEETAIKEASRCLYCDEVCNICVSVCPNIANYYYEVEPFSKKYPVIELADEKIKVTGWKTFEVKQKYQIININDFCNECGNCETFCPTDGAPYKIKPKFALNKESFDEMSKGYFLDGDKLAYKEDSELHELVFNDNEILYSDKNFESTFDLEFNPVKVSKKFDHKNKLNTRKVVEMYYYLTNLKKTFICN